MAGRHTQIDCVCGPLLCALTAPRFCRNPRCGSTHASRSKTRLGSPSLGEAHLGSDEETRTVDGGSATWGVKQSFRNYIAMPFVHGSTTLTAPATQNEDGTFTFTNATGEVTGDKATIAFAGGVNFAGHDIGEGPVLEIGISNIRVDIDGTSGSIVADLASREFINTTTRGEMKQYDDVRLVDLNLTDAPMTVSEDVVSVDGATAELTAAGEEAFGGFYVAFGFRVNRPGRGVVGAAEDLSARELNRPMFEGGPSVPVTSGATGQGCR